MAEESSIYRSQESGVRGQAAAPRDNQVANQADDRDRDHKSADTRTAKDLIVYRKAYELAMRVFEQSQSFPAEERYALTSQIRRSARSVCMTLREAWAKRRYPAHFLSKLTDSDGENSETDTSLDFARDCGYITTDMHAELSGKCAEIGRMLGAMIRSPEKFLPPQDLRAPRLHEDPLPNVNLTPDSCFLTPDYV